MNGLGFWFPVPIHAVPQSLEGGVDAALDQSAGQQAEPTHDVGDLLHELPTAGSPQQKDSDATYQQPGN